MEKKEERGETTQVVVVRVGNNGILQVNQMPDQISDRSMRYQREELNSIEGTAEILSALSDSECRLEPRVMLWLYDDEYDLYKEAIKEVTSVRHFIPGQIALQAFPVRLGSTDNDQDVASLTRELQQTKTKLDDQTKDIRILACAVSVLDVDTNRNGEVLRKVTDDTKELKTTVDALKDEFDQLTAQNVDQQAVSIQQQEQITQFEEQITQRLAEIANLQEKTTELCEKMEEKIATDTEDLRKLQADAAQQNALYDSKLAKQQEQMDRMQAQIDALSSILPPGNLTKTCVELREDVDKIGELREDVDKIGETMQNGRGAVDRPSGCY